MSTCCSKQQHQIQPVVYGNTGTNLLLARVVELCQAPVYEPEFLFLMINHDLHEAVSPNSKRQYSLSHAADAMPVVTQTSTVLRVHHMFK